jgi:hypothetical protein
VESPGTPARTGFWGTATITVPAARVIPNAGFCAWVEGADSFRPTPCPTVTAGVNESIPF